MNTLDVGKEVRIDVLRGKKKKEHGALVTVYANDELKNVLF